MTVAAVDRSIVHSTANRRGWSVALVGYAVAYALWVLAMPDRHWSRALNDALYLPFYGVAIACALGAARRVGPGGGSQRAWRYLAAAFVVPFLGDLLWLAYDIQGPISALPTWAEYAALAYYPLAVLGLQQFPVAHRLRAVAARYWLDAAILLCAGTVLSWYLIFRTTPAFAGKDHATSLFSLTTVAGDLFVFFAAATLVSSVRALGARPALRLLTVGLLLVAVADLWLMYSQLMGTYHSGRILDVLCAVAITFLALAADAQGPDDAEPAPTTTALPSQNVLPYLAVAVVFGLLAYEAWRDAAQEIVMLATAAMALTAMVLGRQVTILRLNRVLAAARVAQDARFRSLVQYSTDVVFVVQRDGAMAYVSPSVDRQLGIAVAGLSGRSLLEFVHPDDRVRVAGALAGAASASGGGAPLAWRMGTDGTWREVEGVLTDLTRDSTVGGLVLNVRDVGDRVRLEEQLRHVQKMDAIGRLAGGIAHDFNNILAAVLANAQLLRAGRDGDAGEVAEIERAAHRGAALTRQLLEFSRADASTTDTHRLNEVVLGMEPMLRRLIAKDVSVGVHVATEEFAVSIDRGQLEQVLLNLAVNARDAMPDGGRLSVRTGWGPVMPDDGRPVNGEAAPRWAMLEVSDNGIGMDAATLTRAFEPFFTTKPRGRGTGLGLATVYGIISKAGGRVELDSEPGTGTTVRVLLPALPVPELVRRATEPPLVAEKRKAVVLVVDDEPAIRSSLSRYLKMRGYAAHDAPDGVAALETLERLSWAVDLVVTDMVMPRMGGRELVQRLRERAPHLPVLCMSGHVDDRDDEADAPWSRARAVTKPFELEDFARRVQIALVGTAAKS